MIVFVATTEHQYTVRDVLETRDHALHGRLVILSHEELLSSPRLPRATYVLADLERLDEGGRARLIRRVEALRRACPGCEVLNLPARIGNRLDIMRRLHEAGVNDFRMLPLDTPAEAFRYPVFLRRLDDHEGPKSDLLDSAQALRDAIAALDPAEREGFAVTEYIDARNDLGLHEKRSYTRVGDRLFPAALDQSRAWVCKGEHSDPNGVPAAERELAFLKGNEDREALRAAFDAAGIQYGRADYAVVGGKPQIFEINTNPYVDAPERVPARARAAAEQIAGAWLAALEALADGAEGARGDWVEVGGVTGGRAGRGFSRRNLARSALRSMRQLHNETTAMRWLRRFRLI
ncbi:hypothetical protein KTN05_14140 [Paracoccus sp. Z118]|uniref:hypothetical protein n=1 Tax=Paracoccus sp. Z118 TaxID=2851017 RepID=UPI001C2C3D24|nr:hypothetical protein [Paracoccus sp. Z118]MBV0892975.1 hypothetical protein [Paracoccus sp. Z118]